MEALKVLEHGLLTLTKDENSKYSFDGMTVQVGHAAAPHPMQPIQHPTADSIRVVQGHPPQQQRQAQ